jgi:hypothetical protein
MSTTAGIEAATETVAEAQSRDDAACGGLSAGGGAGAGSGAGAGAGAGAGVSDAVARVRTGLVSGSGWQGIDVDSLPRAELLATHRDLARMRRELDAMLAYSSAAIARRSTPEDGQEGLAKREGYRTPEELIASISGGSTGDAHRLIEVGDMLASDERDARTGDGLRDGSEDGVEAVLVALSPRFAVVSDRVRAGKLSVEAGNLIKRMLVRIWDRREALGLELSDIERVERILVERAHGLSSNRFAKIVGQLEARMDSGRHALTEELQRQERYVTMFEDAQGMFILKARLDAETAAPVRAALDALVGNALHNRRGTKKGAGSDERRGFEMGKENHEAGLQLHDSETIKVSQIVDDGQVFEDDRSVTQIRADALAALARHCLGCTSKDLPFASTTVAVRMTLTDLQNGTGVAEIDGGNQPICISTARRMAANGGIIPIVLGGKGEILDLGRETRPFNYYQRIALIERDGGCAFCGAPPAYTEAHHIRWWARDCGPTDLNNGLLLCSVCHHRIHRDNWDIDIRDNQVWFTPPAAVDRDRTPRLGGRARYGPPTFDMLKLDEPKREAA